MSLLPTSSSEFKSKHYWDDFFSKRGKVAFEWYGTFSSIIPYLRPHIRPNHRFLVPGCGNSEFSSDLFDAGYRNIFNFDFSELVVEEMRAKNVTRCSMQWEVSDMTNMKEYSSNDFDIVFDKGSLDALMSEDTTETRAKAVAMFNEISRTLKVGGKYIIITLAEKFIFESLLSYFSCDEEGGAASCGWDVVMHAIAVDQTNNKRSPFIPFFIVVTKKSTPRSVKQNIKVCFNQSLTPLKESAVPAADKSEVAKYIYIMQTFHQRQFELSRVQLGRFESIEIWSPENQKVPRFTIHILDAADYGTPVARSCAVFIVPFGRESEYQFCSQEGLWEIANQANCLRLLAVCCNRPHSFPEMKDLQKELSPIAMNLRIIEGVPADEEFPFMALNTENEWEEVAYGESDVSGPYVVEESPADEHNPNLIMRRLFFLQNQNFVQTEVRLLTRSGSGGGKKKSGGGGKKKSGAKNAKKSGSDRDPCLYDFDFSYLDEHHKGMLSAAVLMPEFVESSHTVKHPPSSTAAAVQSLRPPGRGLLIGLGGGALALALQRYLPALKLSVCEWDPEVCEIAKKHFAFKCNARSVVLVEEGMAAIRRLDASIASGSGDSSSVDIVSGGQPIDWLILDVDSKDVSLGLSAPPQEFITEVSLSCMYSVLRPGGLLTMNVVARSKSQRSALINRIAHVFNVSLRHSSAVAGEAGVQSTSESAGCGKESTRVREEPREGLFGGGRIFMLKASDETVNVTLLVQKGSEPLTGTVFTKAPATSASDQSARVALLRNWLKAVGLSLDPLELSDMLPRMHEITEMQ